MPRVSRLQLFFFYYYDFQCSSLKTETLVRKEIDCDKSHQKINLLIKILDNFHNQDIVNEFRFYDENTKAQIKKKCGEKIF